MSEGSTWRKAKLDDVVDLRLSSVDKKSKPGERVVRLCNYVDVYKSRFIRPDMGFMLATATDREIAKCTLLPGDVVITKDSEKYDDIGVPALIRETIPKLVCGYHLAILRPNPECIDGTYLFYAVSAYNSAVQFHSLANGVTRFGLRKDDILRVEIPLPPLSEQRAIADILGTLDDSIELNRRMNESLEEMARTLFKSWFVGFDPVRAKMEGRWRAGESLPGLPAELFDLFPDRLSGSEVGPIPEGWQIKIAGEAVTVKGGTTPKTKEPAYWGGKHWFATPKDLSFLQEPILCLTARQLTDAGVSQIGSGLLPAGTLLLSSRAPIGYLAITQVPVTVNQGIIAMICNDTVGAHYALNWTHANMAIIEAYASGTTFSEISKSSFRSIPFLVPSVPVHAAWESIVAPLYSRVVSNVNLRHTLTHQRDALLPQLLSRKLRVKVPV